MHSIEYRVYYEDTDAQGVVYYANYLKFCERARTEYLRLLGYEQKELLDIGVIFIVRKVIVEYLKPANLDELIKIETRLNDEKSGTKKWTRLALPLSSPVWRGLSMSTKTA